MWRLRLRSGGGAVAGVLGGSASAARRSRRSCSQTWVAWMVVEGRILG